MHVLLLALVLLAQPPVSQDGNARVAARVEPAQEEAPALDRALVELESRGLASSMPDPRDRGLLGALALLGDRIAELPAEIGGDMMLPPGALEVLGQLLSRPIALRVLEDPAGGELPVRAELVVLHEEPGAARLMVEQAIELLAMAGFERASEVDTSGTEPSELIGLHGPLPIWIGARGEAFVLAAGAEPGTEIQRPASQGPASRLSIEVGRLLEVALDLGADPGLGDVIELIGAEARFETEVWFAEGAQVQRVVLAAPKLGIRAAPLERSLLQAMPLQATWAIASSVSPLEIARWLRSMSDAAGDDEDPFAELEEMLGIDLEQDLLAHLGAGWGAYASAATGGGGLMSLVALWEVSDRHALSSTLDRLAVALGRVGAERARGYVRVATSRISGAPAWTVTFPGLPVPLQPTLALGGRHLVLGMHPAGARAALAFTQEPGGLSDDERVAQMLAAGGRSLAGIYYMDAPSLIADGYGYALALGQMLENGLRSPLDPTREAPQIVPPLAELLQGARAWTGALRIEGGILRLETQTDASAIARFAAQMGLMPAMYQMMIGPSMMMMPWMMVSSDEAIEVQIMTRPAHQVEDPFELEPAAQARFEIMAIANAVDQFAIDNAGRYPESLDWLVLPDEHGQAYLEGGPEALVDPWGRVYGYELPSAVDPRPRVYTLGRDGRPGGTGEDADIDNWTILEGR